MSRRGWAVVGIIVVLAAGAAAAVGISRSADGCGEQVTSLAAAESSSPFLDAAGREEQPDEDRDRAVEALGRAPAPFGPVEGAVGYHYEQWAQLSSYAQGIGVRTRDNPDFTMLDDKGLRPLWSVQVGTRRSTYDADENTYLVATMPNEGAPELVALDARTGKRKWCAGLGGPRVGDSDPFATQLLDDGGVAVLGPGAGDDERVVRFDGRGERVWTRQLEADEGDFLGSLGDDLLLAGGWAQFRLADPEALADRPAGTSLTALDLDSGRTVWRRSPPERAGDHVVGVDGATSVVTERRGDAESLVGLEPNGREAWSVDPPVGGSFDTALRAGRVLVRGTGQDGRWAAYAAGTGRQLWRRTMPTRPQLLPYGFQLDEMPLLDDDRAVLGTTTGLRVLDLRTGAFTATAPLPTDGINTTFWPYRVTVSGRHVAVATNTSAVILQRR